MSQVNYFDLSNSNVFSRSTTYSTAFVNTYVTNKFNYSANINYSPTTYIYSQNTFDTFLAAVKIIELKKVEYDKSITLKDELQDKIYQIRLTNIDCELYKSIRTYQAILDHLEHEGKWHQYRDVLRQVKLSFDKDLFAFGIRSKEVQVSDLLEPIYFVDFESTYDQILSGIKESRYQTVISQILSVMEEYQPLMDFRSMLVDCYVSLGQYEEAIPYISELRVENMGFASLVKLSQLYYKTKAFSDAAEILTVIVEKNPNKDDKSYHFMLARVS